MPLRLVMTDDDGGVFPGTVLGSSHLGLGLSTLLKDSFTDTNGTALGSHTMDVGPGWTVSSGTWSIQSNQCQRTSTTAAYQAVYSQANQSDVTVQADIITASSGSYTLGLACRASDAGNMIVVGIGDASLNRFNIYEVNNGTFTQRAIATVTINASTAYTIKAVLSGQSITATLNGANQISYGSESFHQTTTTHGLYCYYDGTTFLSHTFDNFLVTQP